MIRISAIDALDHDLQRLAGERDELARALGHACAERLERGLALRRDLDVDAVVVEPVLQLRELRVGVVDDARDVVAGTRPTWSADRVREHRGERRRRPR